MALKILLADDSMTAQNMGKKILAENGFEVITVSNGAAAVKKLASEKPDIAILDVYMPGYSGLEVCQKIRQAAETAAMPVLLTVGKMEAFQPEEGDRVKADGIMIKPFEASDLVAAVHKFQERLRPAAKPAAPEYEKTVRVKAPLEEFGVGEEEWRTEAAPAPFKIELPHEMTAAPAFGMEDLMPPLAGAPAASPETVAPAAQPSPAEAPVTPAASTPDSAPFGVEPAAGEFGILPTEPVFPGFELPASPDLTSVSIPGMDELLSTPEPVVEPVSGVEFTSASQVGEIEITTVPELEIPSEPAPADMVIAPDPALATSPDDLAQFTTRFGPETAEDIALGVPEAGVAESAPVAKGSPAAPLPWETPPLPPVEPGPLAAPKPAVDPLVAEFSAALEKVAASTSQPGPEPQTAAAPAESFDEQRVAEAVQRVLQRLKPQFVAEILRELKDS